MGQDHTHSCQQADQARVSIITEFEMGIRGAHIHGIRQLNAMHGQKAIWADFKTQCYTEQLINRTKIYNTMLFM